MSHTLFFATKEQIGRIQDLYCEMPGAPMPPIVDGEPMWGDVEGNEHWCFCESIVKMIDTQVGRAVNSLASAHNLV